ncbi:DEKNAAC100807 [Brettanomyces naardenensis]|uniref:6-O-methylguanine-DNA methyltransferase n=1 Tax=Brettanomyces naardenensis TaxID=13370 RepID=A0A448YEK8_BRENA|nr:DEKNAAC100807 [Brettanomyces naardenensis]
MPKIPTEEQLTFHYAVYSKVCEIPYGQTTSYGHIAKLIHYPRNPRQVGMSLKHMDYYLQFLNDEDDRALFDPSSIPWWRVINSEGGISKRETPEAVRRQVERLRQEGVEVETQDWTRQSSAPSSWTPYHVNFQSYGWFPHVQGEDDEDESSDSVTVKQEDEGL